MVSSESSGPFLFYMRSTGLVSVGSPKASRVSSIETDRAGHYDYGIGPWFSLV